MDRPGEQRGRLPMTALVVIVLAGIFPASAAAEAFDPSQIVFPVVGEVSFFDDFEQTRSGGRTHGATDIMGDKLQPVVAAADGVVTWIGSTCCYLALDHGGGWETWYVHLNNDTPGTDDGGGWGIAEGIVDGATVRAGQLIGWVGDSGNAEHAGAHLHFEIRRDDVPINPYPYLLEAPRLGEPGALVSRASSGRFDDDDGSVHEADIEALAERGISRGCTPEGDRYCPEDEITRGEIAAFLRRALDLPAGSSDDFVDAGESQFADDIASVTSAGIGFGCTDTEYCPDAPLRRDEMAELVVRAFGFPVPDEDLFEDDGDSSYQSSIDALGAAGVTRGCEPGEAALFCPDRHLTRAEMASFLVRALEVADR